MVYIAMHTNDGELIIQIISGCTPNIHDVFFLIYVRLECKMNLIGAGYRIDNVVIVS